MKSSILTTLCVVFVFFVFSQHEYNPPGNFPESFQKEYPPSQATHWTHSSNGWSANFDAKDHNNGEVTAHFDRNGGHIDTHVPYDNNDVPAPVIENVKNRYPGSDHYDVTCIDRTGDHRVYQFQLRHKNRNRTYFVDENGQQRGDYHDRHY